MDTRDVEYQGCPEGLVPAIWSELEQATEGDTNEMMGILTRMLLEMCAMRWPTSTDKAIDGIIKMLDSAGRDIARDIAREYLDRVDSDSGDS